MLKKIFQLVILVTLNVGCREIKTAKLVDNNSRLESKFKVAILLPDKIDKSGWSKSGYQGLKLIETELDAEIAYKDNLADYLEAEERKNILRQYALSGFDYIIGHGGSFQSEIEIVAKEFPRTKFALTSSSSSGNNQNLGVLHYKRYEAGYLAGVVAALKTKTNKIGFIGGAKYNITQAQATLLERGAKSIKPNINVTIEWVGSWTNTAKGTAIAGNLIKNNIDVLVLNGEKATENIYPIAKANNTSIIEWNTDRYKRSPEQIITSVIIDTPKLLLKGATLVREGHWQGRKYSFGLRDGIIKLAPFRDALTSEEKIIVEQAKDDILTDRVNLLP